MINYIVLHCSASPNDREVTAEEIHTWHKTRTPPFDGIGYHYVIRRDGITEACRPIFWEGAHVRGHNHESIGICLVGDNEFTGAQMKTLKELLYVLKFKFQEADICGHYELDSGKTCPNFNVKSFVEDEMPGVEHTVRH